MQHKKESGSTLEFNKVNTNNMKKKIQVLVFSLFISTIGFSQNCYSVLANLNGMDISAYQGELNAKSCELKTPSIRISEVNLEFLILVIIKFQELFRAVLIKFGIK